MTLGELKAQIADWLDREDLSGRIPDFIRQAETVIYRGLRTRDNEFTKVYPDPSLPVPDLASPLTLPDNYREMKLVLINGRQAIRISDQDYFIRRQQDPGDWDSSAYYYFTVIERKLYLFPWPEAIPVPDGWGDNQIDIIYYGTESIVEMATWNTPTNPNTVPESEGDDPSTTIREDEATSRLLQVAPDAYLYQSLAQALKFLKQYEEAGAYEQMARAALSDLVLEDDVASYAGSTVSVSSVYHD